ncbi:glycoside hydrolase family 63 protein [Sphaerobolus stellatus SS14]|uniref:Mannosyl-oligosaccharide glucosidase n=1 Tax=Sphaerobolus stellatus (strain SS14) TaxID=990650 RepID=A0A0C9U0C8_SPHS4|nr:glycoside hydrolase family 63 protein [Sphaerobolus stellatus SS14]
MRSCWLLPLSLLLSTAVEAANNDSQSLFWGTWRPNLYFGLRPRLPHSLMTGLMWFGTQDYLSVGQTRHQCDQGDGLDAYTWTAHDPREGGVEILKDGKNNVEITIEWLKVLGGDHGGSWAARIKGVPMDPERPTRTSFIPYFGLEGLGSLDLENEEDDTGLEGQIALSGSSPDLGDFKIRIVEHPDNKAVLSGAFEDDFHDTIGRTPYLGINLEDDTVWKAKDVVMSKLITLAQSNIESYRKAENGYPDPSFVLRLPNEVYSGSNLFAIQKTFDGKFQFDIFFESDSVKQKLDSSLLDQGIPAFNDAFEHRFKSIFPLPSTFGQSELEFSEAITSNLLGGIGYFYGNSIVDKAPEYEWDEDEDTEEAEAVPGKATAHYTEPKQLLTATPSRSFFPRGFYWDEGFHLLHIGAWDTGLALDILHDWIDLIDENGWVAREQILGEEARSRVPSEFVNQHPTYANPPTLTMAIMTIVSRMRTSREIQDPLADFAMPDSAQLPFTGESASRSAHQPTSDEALTYLKTIYPALKRHYEWFRRTQRGQIKQYSRTARSRTEAYRWRGRSPTHVLTSGMDDYPRGPPHAGELHLDLISWMGFFTKTMRDMADFIGEREDEVASLYTIYAAQPGPYQERAREIYTKLRENIIKNVHNEYVRTGYVWEQYDALTGEGRRSHPFTGWTSLVTLSES